MDQENEDFPSFTCICELCDCGKHKRHRGCRRLNGNVQIGWGFDNQLISDYKCSFAWPHDVHCCTKPLLSQNVAKGIPASTKGTDTTTVKWPVTPKEEPPHRRLKVNACGDNCHCHTKSFPRIGELSAVVGSLLYPDKREKMQTTSRREFVQKSGERQEQKQMPVSLKLEGERQFVTTHQEEYKPYPHVEPAAVRERRAATRAEPVPAPMEHLTKYRCDFRQKDCKPQRRSPAMQHPDNLGINLALRSDFRTVQMDSYPGWDASEHLRPEPAKLKEELVVNGDAEFQGDTVTKLDFQRLPLITARQQPAKAWGSNLDLLQGPFNGQTSNRDFFKDWGVKTRVRHGDLYDTGHMKPVRAERATICKPLETAAVQGEQDFSTVHQEAYRPISLPVCRLRRYLQNHPTMENDEKLALRP
ncbi:uncharacterized protein si:dkeyp-69c1.9 isoform X2 [Brienomyrus brachyistius]|uniref:uncharacterized protein si:dkeyp-69c1.9 isoform X2 n=1 Tax=Brienomyrus brachyistius TaxID=42636 RepID=UPI0020B1DA75|nr:uncharacterized protein si:dkeyp-69c1.9 isoform X2 [Brienomyrus brachyistius]